MKTIILLLLILSYGYTKEYSNHSISDTIYFNFIYPVDTILVKTNLSPIQRFSIRNIRKWQTYSYHNPNTDCQFYPSCSNYCAIHIKEHGTIPGLIIGADRFIRCNNSAQKRYQIYSDGYILPEDRRISDNLILKENVKKRSKHIILGMTFSIIPGLGRAYYGQIADGVNSFKYTTPFILSSYYLHENNNDILSVLTGCIAMIFWGSEFYGVYNLSKIYKHPSK